MPDNPGLTDRAEAYTGNSMADSRKDSKVSSKEWQAFLEDFQQTLDKFKVPAEEQAEPRAIVNSSRDDIVIGSSLVASSKS